MTSSTARRSFALCVRESSEEADDAESRRRARHRHHRLNYGHRAVDGYRPDGEELVLVGDVSGVEYADGPYWVGGPQSASDEASIRTVHR